MVLVWLILIPMLGGLLCWQTDRFGNLPRWIALFTMTLVTLLAVDLWLSGDYQLAAGVHDAPYWEREFHMQWIPSFGIAIRLGIDGLSLVLVILTAFLGVLSVLCSWTEIQKHTGFFHLNLLWILGGVIGVFLALDLFLFFMFWEMMLVPMYFLIALWGHRAATRKSRITAATKFFIYTQASGLLMLLSILGLVFAHFEDTGVLSFDYDILRGTTLTPTLEFMLMLGFFIAFAVKLPIVPLHGWLPDAHSQAPTAGSVDLAGLLLKTAAYGMLRFVLPFFPDASAEFAPIAIWLGIASIVYGAVLAFAQTDIKRLVAYTSIAHMGYVLMGIYAGGEMATKGAIVQMLAHGLSSAALFILCGQVYERLHTLDMRQMGGLWSRMPLIPPFMLFFAVASLGLPGTGNFIGEFLILAGSYAAARVPVIIAAFGLVLGAAYSLAMVHRSMFGPTRADTELAGSSKREALMMLTLVVGTLWLGLHPQPVLDVSERPVALVQEYYPPQAKATGVVTP